MLCSFSINYFHIRAWNRSRSALTDNYLSIIMQNRRRNTLALSHTLACAESFFFLSILIWINYYVCTGKNARANIVLVLVPRAMCVSPLFKVIYSSRWTQFLSICLDLLCRVAICYFRVISIENFHSKWNHSLVSPAVVKYF